ncbi:MAG: bifunctional glutamate N-acetyltransferase/amino-acid acetyltransferase ArgJ [Kiritimatiellae bacterium]|nr:bifunctional glutamate N-acetyltransferase/amino-acid acetyltransferase ArgJ [Kiritimatiellia bacterium]
MTTPRGFLACGIHAGIKTEGPDLALLVSECPAAAAGVFTTNVVQGHHIKLCRARLATRRAQAVVINSGNANACTGRRGLEDAEQTARIAGQALGIDEQLVLVCSTGVIGVPLPMDKIEAGIRSAAGKLSVQGGQDAARAILTTDRMEKTCAFDGIADGVNVRIGGMAKGAGMIEPHLATMLAFLTTDAAVVPEALQSCLKHAVAESFNRIIVDGDQSCNDTVLFLANGLAGNRPLDRDNRDWPDFEAAVTAAARELALKIVEDGEGATKLVTVAVKGALNDWDAEKAARTVARSLLVKTSWYGEDPNWGRVLDALGYSGAALNPDLVDISYDNVPAVRAGCAVPSTGREDLRAVLKKRTFCITIDLHLGNGTSTIYSSDCSEEYVRVNSHYTT